MSASVRTLKRSKSVATYDSRRNASRSTQRQITLSSLHDWLAARSNGSISSPTLTTRRPSPVIPKRAIQIFNPTKENLVRAYRHSDFPFHVLFSRSGQVDAGSHPAAPVARSAPLTCATRGFGHSGTVLGRPRITSQL